MTIRELKYKKNFCYNKICFYKMRNIGLINDNHVSLFEIGFVEETGKYWKFYLERREMNLGSPLFLLSSSHSPLFIARGTMHSISHPMQSTSVGNILFEIRERLARKAIRYPGDSIFSLKKGFKQRIRKKRKRKK